MSSPDQNDRRNDTHQSIPLRDLNRPPDHYDEHTQGAAQHRRTLSDRGRELLRHSGSLATGQHWNPQYAPIAEGSPSPTSDGARHHIDTALAQAREGRAPANEEQYSPVDAGAFQAAIGFSGLSFQGATSPPSHTTAYGHHADDAADAYDARGPSEDTGYFSSVAYKGGA